MTAGDPGFQDRYFRGNMKNKLCSRLTLEINNQTYHQIHDQVRHQADYLVSRPVRDQLCGQVWLHINRQVWQQVLQALEARP